jgi:uncharacterized membrane protein
MTKPIKLTGERQAFQLPSIDHAAAFVLRHGLAFVLAGMLTFTLLPFAAPLAMQSGWDTLGHLLYRFYGLFCHQMPQRSWFFFGSKLTYTLAEIQQVSPASSLWELRAFVGTPSMGWKVAWSDRMISFYTLTPLFGIAYVLVRWIRRRIAPLPWTVLLITLLPLAIDGGTHAVSDGLSQISSASGFRDTNQWLALATVNAFPGFYAGDQLGTFNWWMRLVTGALAAWGIAFTVFPLIDQLIEQEVTLSGSLKADRRTDK